MTNKLKIKFVSFRIYKTNDIICDQNDHTKIQNFNPIAIDNFPEIGYKLKLFFGKVPNDIIKIKNHLDALIKMGYKAVDKQFDFSLWKSDRFNDYINEIERNSNFLKSQGWYSTLIIEEEVDILESYVIDEYGKLNRGLLLRHLREFRSKNNLSQIIDKITICLMTEFRPDFFSNILFEDDVILIDKNKIIGLPSIAAEGLVWTEHSKSSIDQENIIRLIEKINFPNYRWFSSVAFWRVSMLIEKDEWKKFYFGYLALELLIHKVFKEIHVPDEFIDHIKNCIEIDDQTKKRILEEGQKPNIITKLSYVSYKINPEIYQDDLSIFKELKEIRDNMSHGNIKSIFELKIYELESLLNRYIMGKLI